VAYKYRASFCGYFPADEPRYSCIVLIAEPSSGWYYASSVAAPVFREIADKIYATEFDLHKNPEPPQLAEEFHLPVSKDGSTQDLIKVYESLGIPYELTASSDWCRIKTGIDSVAVDPYPLTEGLVPRVIGMGLQDAIFLLENAGLKVVVNGHGTVKRQSVPAGARLDHHSTITLELS
jgi:cell division protein FtsI (penicillin-binding protein 3)